MISLDAMKRLHSVTFALFCCWAYVFAGWNVPVTNYAVADYAAGTQNWQILTTANGWLYTANNYGLLEFDGSDWRVYGMYYGNLPRSITALDDRAVFIGATNDFGVFTPNATGGMNYTSLLDSLTHVEPDFGEVWDIEILGQQVYFFTRHRIIMGTYDGRLNDVQQVKEDSRIFCAEEAGGAVYVGTDDGLYLLTGTRMNKIHGSDILHGYEVRCLQSLDDRRLLIATDLGGLYVYDGTRIAPFPTEADAFIRKNQLYTFAVREDKIALGTVQQGIVVVDTAGKEPRYISRKEGLQNNTVLSMSFDRTGNLWVGLDQGIDYVHLASSRQYFSDEQTNFGAGYAALRVERGGTTYYYYGTNQALYVKTNTTAPLRLVEGSMGQVWSLSEIAGTVFCCHNRGLFVVEGNRARPLCTDEGFWKVQQLPDGRVIAGSYSGFWVMEKRSAVSSQRSVAGEWQLTKVKGFDDTAFRWQVDATGAIWAVATSGVVRLEWAEPATLIGTPVQPYNGAHDWINISRLGENILISSRDYCRVVGQDGVLRKDASLFAELDGETYYALTYRDKRGNNLYVRDGVMYVRARTAEGYGKAYPLYGGTTDFVGGFENIYENENGYIVGTLQGYSLIQSAMADGRPVEQSRRIYLREVSRMNHNGEVVYGESLDIQEGSEEKETFVLPYDRHALRFACSINRVPAGDTRYAFRLLPRDKDFTQLGNRSYYECSSLEEGRYTLEVICLTAAEDDMPCEIRQAWTFSIQAPWYRTWWARVLEVLFVLFWLAVLGYMIYVYADRSKRKTLHEQQLRILQLENDKAQTRLQAKSQELTRILHNEANRQEEIAAVSEAVDKTIRDIQAHNFKKAEERLQALKQHITEDRDNSIEWERFEENFDEVNAGFCKILTERYPWMNKQERKLCIYIRLGMQTKEIAPMLGLSTRGVEMMRYRMRCKMQLDAQANLKDYLTKITSNT